MAFEQGEGGGGGGGTWWPSWGPSWGQSWGSGWGAQQPQTYVSVFGGGTQEAWGAAQQAFQQAYMMDYLQYQDRWHAQEIAEQAAMRELQEAIALGYINGKPTLERQLGEGSMLGYYGGKPTLQRQLGEGQLGLGYLGLLASKSGPSDWLRYWNVARAARQTGLPAWAASLARGLKLPAWQGPTMEPGEVPPVWQGPAQGVSGGGASLPGILPQQVTPEQWRNMLPSEVAGLQGLVEAEGGWWPDWQKQMMASWPTGGASGRTVWQG